VLDAFDCSSNRQFVIACDNRDIHINININRTLKLIALQDCLLTRVDLSLVPEGWMDHYCEEPKRRSRASAYLATVWVTISAGISGPGGVLSHKPSATSDSR